MTTIKDTVPEPPDRGLTSTHWGGTHHLLSSHAHRLDGELATAHVEQILQVWSQEVDDENVVQAFLTEIMYLGNAGCTDRKRD